MSIKTWPCETTVQLAVTTTVFLMDSWLAINPAQAEKLPPMPGKRFHKRRTALLYIVSFAPWVEVFQWGFSLVSVPLGTLYQLNYQWAIFKLSMNVALHTLLQAGTACPITLQDGLNAWSVTPLDSTPDWCVKASVEFYKVRDVQSNKHLQQQHLGHENALQSKE